MATPGSDHGLTHRWELEPGGRLGLALSDGRRFIVRIRAPDPQRSTREGRTAGTTLLAGAARLMDVDGAITRRRLGAIAAHSTSGFGGDWRRVGADLSSAFAGDARLDRPPAGG